MRKVLFCILGLLCLSIESIIMLILLFLHHGVLIPNFSPFLMASCNIFILTLKLKTYGKEENSEEITETKGVLNAVYYCSCLGKATFSQRKSYWLVSTNQREGHFGMTNHRLRIWQLTYLCISQELGVQISGNHLLRTVRETNVLLLTLFLSCLDC